jgi:hypothetical protein
MLFTTSGYINSTGFLALGGGANGTGNTLYLETDGNVGIGTTAPVSKLNVVGGALSVGDTGQFYGHSTFPDVGPSAEIGYYPSGSYAFVQAFDRGDSTRVPLHLIGSTFTVKTGTSNDSRLTIDTNGNVGIGTTSPTAPLDTNGVRIGRNFSLTGRATIRLDSNGVNQPADILLGHTAAANETSWTGVYWSLSSRANTDGNKFHIYRAQGNPTGASEAVLFTIQPNGNVGIGTTSPRQRLDVNGNAHFGNHLIGTGIRASGRGEFYLNSTGIDTVSEMFFGYGAGHTEENIRWGISDRGVTDGTLEFYRGPANGSFSSVMTLTKNLRVGIGLTNPGSLLEVGPRTFGANFNNVLTVNSSTGNIASDTIKLVNATATILGRGVGLSFYSDNATKMAQIFTQTTDSANTSRGSLTLDTTFGNIILSPNNGNVGIGTTSPSRKVHINSGTNDIGLLVESSDRYAKISLKDDTTSSDAQVMIVADGNEMFFETSSAERLRIDSTGNVGIGTTSPGSKLEVFGGVNIGGTGTVADASLHIKQSYGGFNRLTQIQPIGNSKPALNLMSSTNSSGANQWWSWGVNNDIFTLQPGTAFSGSTGLFINRSGNVGIGTTSPATRLHVVNNTAHSTEANNEFAAIFETSSYSGVKVKSNSSGYAPSSIYLEAGNSGTRGQGIFHFNSVSDKMWFSGTPYETNGDRYIIATATGSSSSVAQNGSALLTILNSGNVGIGTTSPGVRLQVEGAIRGGSFPNSTTNSAEAWFGRAADRALGSMTFQLGGTTATDTRFEIVDRA